MKVLVTGAAGFIGFHTSLRLLADGHEVVGFDNLNDYYPVAYKRQRLEILLAFDHFTFVLGDICDPVKLRPFVKDCSHVIHLAAQAGVRYSAVNPMLYVQTNTVGFQNVLDLVHEFEPTNFVYASSSSVYGGEKPFRETQKVASPKNLYAATKLGNELSAAAYGHNFGTLSTGLRFFSVYGTFARPDMVMYIFADRLMKDEKIPMFNGGENMRDFTHVDDIVDGILLALDKPQVGAIYNLSSAYPVALTDVLAQLAVGLDIKDPDLGIEVLPAQPGDVEYTRGNINKARKNLGFRPKVGIRRGIADFCSWFKERPPLEITRR